MLYVLQTDAGPTVSLLDGDAGSIDFHCQCSSWCRQVGISAGLYSFFVERSCFWWQDAVMMDKSNCRVLWRNVTVVFCMSIITFMHTVHLCNVVLQQRTTRMNLYLFKDLVSFQSPVWFLFVNLPHCKQVSRSGFVRCSGMRKVRLKHPIVIVTCSGGTNGSITVCATWLQWLTWPRFKAQTVAVYALRLNLGQAQRARQCLL